MGAQCCANDNVKKENTLNIAAEPEIKKASREAKKEGDESFSGGTGAEMKHQSKAREKKINRSKSIIKQPVKSEPPSHKHVRIYEAPVAKVESDKPEIYHVHEVLEFNPKTAMMKGHGKTTKFEKTKDSPTTIRHSSPVMFRLDPSVSPDKAKQPHIQ